MISKFKFDFYSIWAEFDNAAIAKIPNFYDAVWAEFDNAAIAKIPNFYDYDFDGIPSIEEKQRDILYKTIIANHELFNKFKTEDDVLDMIDKITESLKKCDVIQYTNAIINIFRVARLTNDLEKGFELYEKIK